MDAVSEELWQLYNYEALAPVDGKKNKGEEGKWIRFIDVNKAKKGI